MDRVEQTYQEGVKLVLQGTPSFFLAGKSISTPAGIESFKVLIDKELEKSINTN